MKIGIWNGYDVNMIKDQKMVDGVYWTITDKNGKEQNRFESAASFGQWVYRTGFKGEGLKKKVRLVFGVN